MTQQRSGTLTFEVMLMLDRRFVFVMSTLVAGGVLVGCNESSPTSTTTPTTSTQAQAVTSGSANGMGGGGPDGHGPPHAMPPEAYTACASLAVGAACTVKMGDKDMTGKCAAPPPGATDTRASCRPEGGPGGPHGPGGPGGPPPGGSGAPPAHP